MKTVADYIQNGYREESIPTQDSSSSPQYTTGTPPSNTGVLKPNNTTSDKQPFPLGVQIPTIGWITFTCKLKTASPPSPSETEPRFAFESSELRQAFRAHWTQLTGDTWRERCPGLNYYDYSWRSALGLKLCYSEGRSDWSCSINQDALAALTLQQQQDLLWVITENFYGSLTRLDLTITDTTGIVTRQNLYEVYELDNTNRRSEELKWEDNKRRHKNVGWTFMIGKRVSETYIRIYDKYSEQFKKGNNIYPENTIQWEQELKGKQANSQLPLLLNTPVADWLKLFKSTFRAACDFVDRSANARASRCPLLDWWQEFTENCSRFREPRIQVKPSVEKVLDWFQHGVGSTLAFLSQGFGKEYAINMIDCIMQEYSDKLNNKQKFLLQRMQPTC